MHRTQKKLLEEVRRVDLIVEVRDARLPQGSANPELERIAGGRPRLILLNKASLADPAASEAWLKRLDTQGLPALLVDAEQARDAQRVLERALALTVPRQRTLRDRGIRPPDPRVMIVGIPNVGKSTLINRLLKRKRLATGPAPGVTRATQWVPLRGKMLLLDTPGVLLPRIETDLEALRLAWIGALPQHLLAPERLATTLLQVLAAQSEPTFPGHYALPVPLPLDPADWLPAIARSRSLLIQGAEPDLPRAAELVLRDFREGRLGRVTLEPPPAP